MTPDTIAREDLSLFIGAALAATGQREFAASADEQRLSLAFLHDYVLAGYRRLYARCLAAGINHHNQAEILARLLAAGAPAEPEARAEEAGLIRAALRSLPPQRVYRLIAKLRAARVNNRRTRAALRDWLARRDPVFDAVKYRGPLRGASRHAHLKLPGELSPFLFDGPWSRKRWDTPLFDTFRRTRYEQRAVFELPYTIAEGLAASKGIARKRLLEEIEGRLTTGERARLEQSRAREGAKLDELDLPGMGLTRLAIYVLSRPVEERREQLDRLAAALDEAAAVAARRGRLQLGRVAVVLDRSFSTSGSREKRRRPLAVAMAADALIRAAAAEHRCFPTAPLEHPVLLTPRGQTNLAGPLLDALAWDPELVVLLSDGAENDPPGATAEVMRLARARLGLTTPVVHLSTVYDQDQFQLASLGPGVPTVGLRDAEDLPAMLGFARFVAGSASFAELDAWLATQAAAFVARHAP